MKLPFRLSVILTVLALLLSACAPAATPTPAALVVPDGLGGELTLSAPAQRVVSLAPSNTEILFAVGAGKQTVAREDFSNFPEEAAALPSVGGNMGSYDLESMVSLTPDLVLASPLTSPESIQAIQDLKLPLLVVPNPKNLAELYANLELVGKLTGHDAEAKTLVESLKAREAKALEVAAKATEKPLVFYELDATEPAKPWTSGPGTFIDLLIGLAGGQNVGASLQGEWAQISQEELIVQNPDLILLGDALYGGVTPEQVAARPGWEAIKAVQNNRVQTFNDDLVSRPGPRLVDGLVELVKVLHPELAGELN
ncbi:MAG: ABC transporter substrate-binding protein [Anaerolineae bacterium]|nr:ABC transporter substrate-binding protein [Anaerolineae bacterium]